MATEITTWAELAAISSGLSGDYVLMNDLSSSDTGYSTYASSSANSGAGWDPLGDSSTLFTGTFDGGNHTISDLYISRSGENYIGLFGYTNGATIENIGIVNCDITGHSYVGGLIGSQFLGDIINSFSSGSLISSGIYCGGLIGFERGSVSNSYSTCSITGNSYVGGLIGFMNRAGEIILSSYSDGSISGSSNVGGFIGYVSSGTQTNCFWDTVTSGQATSAGSEIGKTTTQMQTLSTFSAWDIVGVTSKADGYANHSYVWNIVDGSTYPFLSWEYIESTGWTGKIMGVTNPAKVIGIDVANISKVMGVS